MRAPRATHQRTADAFGVLPPCQAHSRPAMYHFLWLTAKCRHREGDGPSTFSACFVSPFMALSPRVYANCSAAIARPMSPVCLVKPAGAAGRTARPAHEDRPHPSVVNAALDVACGGPDAGDPIFGWPFDRCPDVPQQSCTRCPGSDPPRHAHAKSWPGFFRRTSRLRRRCSARVRRPARGRARIGARAGSSPPPDTPLGDRLRNAPGRIDRRGADHPGLVARTASPWHLRVRGMLWDAESSSPVSPSAISCARRGANGFLPAVRLILFVYRRPQGVPLFALAAPSGAAPDRLAAGRSCSSGATAVAAPLGGSTRRPIGTLSRHD